MLMCEESSVLEHRGLFGKILPNLAITLSLDVKHANNLFQQHFVRAFQLITSTSPLNQMTHSALEFIALCDG
jgi:hypothetical protein